VRVLESEIHLESNNFGFVQGYDSSTSSVRILDTALG